MRNFVQIFNDSYERTIKRGGEAQAFFDSFYHHFLGRSPEIAEAFAKTDMERQREMLKNSFVYIFNFYISKQSSDYLDEIAVRHSKKNLDIRPGLYEEWLNALMDTLKIHDPRFDEDTELAWRIIFAPGVEYMRFHYDR